MKRTILALVTALCVVLGQCSPAQAGQGGTSRPARYALYSALAVATVGALWFGYKKVVEPYLKRRQQQSQDSDAVQSAPVEPDQGEQKEPYESLDDDEEVMPDNDQDAMPEREEHIASQAARMEHFEQVYGREPQGSQFFQFCQDWKELRAFYQELFGQEPKANAFIDFCKDFVAFKERASGRPKVKRALFKQRYNEFKQQFGRDPQEQELAWCQKYYMEYGSLPTDDNALTCFILRHRRR